jgi:hypothetical protein
MQRDISIPMLQYLEKQCDLPMSLILRQKAGRRAASSSSCPSPENEILLHLPIYLEIVGLLRDHVDRIDSIRIPIVRQAKKGQNKIG